MLSNTELFLLIKNNNWDEFLSHCNEKQDYNIKDENGNFLIQYIILYNKIEILKIILQYNVKLDFLDNEGKSILYLCIKYNYLDIIKILISNTKNVIGVPILNIQDKYSLYPLHYAILFENVEIFSYLLDICNLHIYDKNKNTLFNYVMKCKDIIFLEKLLNKNLNINMLNFYLETPLYSACLFNKTEFIDLILKHNPNINLKNKDEKISTLMIVIVNNNIEIFKKMLLLNPDLNTQNIYGETALHIAIQEDNFEIIDNIINYKNYKLNYNLVNLLGFTPLHLILNKILGKINIDNYDIKKFLKKTNLNIQDNNGETCWHLIIKLNIYEKYKKILKKKNNDIFILNKYNITPYDLSYKTDKNLLNIIISSFYFNLLKKKNFLIKWQNKCSKNKIKKNKCYELINEYVLSNKISYPLKKKLHNIDINISEKKRYTFFTGIRLDVITSYIYILLKYDNIKSSITPDFITNKEIIDHYTRISSIQNFTGEFFNFEILWSYHKLFYPSNLLFSLNSFINNENKNIFFIPIGIELEIGSHANIIIIDKHFKTIERFEPNGSEEPTNYYYNHSLLDYSLKIYFEKILPTFIYYEPSSFLPIISFQSLESLDDIQFKRIGDPGGFCVVWCVWYLEQRIKYKIHPKKIISKLISNIKIKNLSFKNLIRSYSNEILLIRDTILEQLNLDINDIINNNNKRVDINNIIKLLTININKFFYK